MSTSTLQTLFLVLGASMIVFWLMLAITPPRKTDLPQLIAVLRYGAVLRTCALIIALAPPALMLFVVWQFPWRDTTSLSIAGASFLATSFLAGLLFVETKGTYVVITEEGVTRFSPWTGLVMLKWTDITQIRYSALNRWFELRGQNRAIRVSRHLSGIGLFSDTVRRKMAPDQFARVSPILEKIPR